MRVWSLKMTIFGSFVHCLPNILHTRWVRILPYPHSSSTFIIIFLSSCNMGQIIRSTASVRLFVCLSVHGSNLHWILMKNHEL